MGACETGLCPPPKKNSAVAYEWRKKKDLRASRLLLCLREADTSEVGGTERTERTERRLFGYLLRGACRRPLAAVHLVKKNVNINGHKIFARRTKPVAPVRRLGAPQKGTHKHEASFACLFSLHSLKKMNHIGRKNIPMSLFPYIEIHVVQTPILFEISLSQVHLLCKVL